MKNTVTNQCPVCGLQGFTPFDKDGYPNYEICLCCSFESGNQYDHSSEADHFLHLRKVWVNKMEAKWWKAPAPKEWNYKDQLENAGLAHP